MAMARSSKGSTKSQGRAAKAPSGHTGHNKNELKHDHDARAAANPAAQKDQFGSRHNADSLKKEQRKTTKPAGKSDLAFRESAQDVEPVRGLAKAAKKGKEKGRARRTPKSGSAK